jgi:5-methylcytosine-specific restriction protein A
MSNRRRPLRGNAYVTAYLKSPAWFARRDRWFATHARNARPLCCAACGDAATAHELELHHLEYAGVIFDGRWRARERHEDLVPLHPSCHELLHRLIERDRVLSHNRPRRAASELALARLHAKLTEGGAA